MTSATEAAKKYLGTAFALYLALAGLLGAIAIIGSAIWANATSATDTGPVIVRDLGIPVLSAAIVTGSIELYAGRRLRMEVATDVIEATFLKQIPNDIYQEVRDHVLQSPVIRREWEVDMYVLEPYADEALCERARALAGADIYIVDSTVNYKLDNTSSKVIDYSVSGGIDLDPPLVDLGMRRFTFISLDGVHTDIPQDVSMDALRDAAPRSIDRITLSIVGQQVDFTSNHRIAALAPAAIRFGLRRAFHAPGQIIFSATVPTVGFRLKIHGAEQLTFRVTALHPNHDALEEVVAGHEWRFGRGLLPWQGFALRSQIRAPSAAALTTQPPTR